MAILFKGSENTNFIKNNNNKNNMSIQTVTIPKTEYEQMLEEIETLRNSKIYKRLIEFELNLIKGKRYTRKDLGF